MPPTPTASLVDHAPFLPSEARQLRHRRVGPPPDTRLRAVVAVPARDEEAEIGRCLETLAAQRRGDGGPFLAGACSAVVVLNNCVDGSFAAAVEAATRLGLPATVLEAVLPPVPSREDKALFAAVLRAGGRVRRSRDPLSPPPAAPRGGRRAGWRARWSAGAGRGRRSPGWDEIDGARSTAQSAAEGVDGLLHRKTFPPGSSPLPRVTIERPRPHLPARLSPFQRKAHVRERAGGMALGWRGETRRGRRRWRSDRGGDRRGG